ncbi:MAG: DinB family protein [Planctomycetales bacterium]
MQDELKLPLQQIRTAREYTLSLLEDLQPEDWYQMPSPPISHIAWQVGHIAMAQFRLCLERLRNLQPGDWDLISKNFLRTFAKGTVPAEDLSDYPKPDEIKAVLHRVYDAVLKEISNYEEHDLEVPFRNPHPIFKTKKEALFFSAQHEMLHAGQIGILRRLLGKSPVR